MTLYKKCKDFLINILSRKQKFVTYYKFRVFLEISNKLIDKNIKYNKTVYQESEHINLFFPNSKTSCKESIHVEPLLAALLSLILFMI